MPHHNTDKAPRRRRLSNRTCGIAATVIVALDLALFVTLYILASNIHPTEQSDLPLQEIAEIAAAVNLAFVVLTSFPMRRLL